MWFVSLEFALFLPVLCACYWLCPARWRNALLLVASVAFYMLHRPAYGVALAWVCAASYAAVRLVASPQATRARLWQGVALVAAPMLWFKLKAPLVHALLPPGLWDSLPGLGWALPLGLSCYTLQAVSLVVDVYRRRTPPHRSPVDHALYVCFLPTVASGPIQHSTALMWQIDGHRGAFDGTLALAGAKRLVWGLFMKLAVADRFGIYVSSVLDLSTHYNSPTVFIALLCFTVQIYCDFAGYSLMAIGTANLLGYRLPDNFRRPLLAVGMKELWTRWHISLSSWLRDYVYIPLGGSHTSPWRSRANVMATFAVSGLWHGVSPSYLCWGLGHGVVVAIDHLLPISRLRAHWLPRLLTTAATIVTLSVLWAFFRSSMHQSLDILRTLFTAGFDGGWMLSDERQVRTTLITMAAMLLVVAVHDLRTEFFPGALASWRRGRTPAVMLYYVLLLVGVLLFGVLDPGQFIYLRF